MPLNPALAAAWHLSAARADLSGSLRVPLLWPLLSRPLFHGVHGLHLQPSFAMSAMVPLHRILTTLLIMTFPTTTPTHALSPSATRATTLLAHAGPTNRPLTASRSNNSMKGLRKPMIGFSGLAAHAIGLARRASWDIALSRIFLITRPGKPSRTGQRLKSLLPLKSTVNVQRKTLVLLVC